MHHSTPIEDKFTTWRENKRSNVVDVMPHPSRSAPLCKDCKHLVYGRQVGSQYSRCNHSAAPVDPVTGHPRATLEQMRDSNAAPTCGPAGTWFELSPSAGCKKCSGRGWVHAFQKVEGLSQPRYQTADCPVCRTAPISAATATTVAGEQGSANSI